MGFEVKDIKSNLPFSANEEVSRDSIMNFQNNLKNIEGVFEGDSLECPLKHSFSDNIYVREIAIPAGMVIVGKIHKHEHPNFLMKGKVEVVTEEGTEIIEAPCSMISKAGTKRALYALTDLVWITVHHNPTNTQDLKELEEEVIAKDYEEYDKFISSKDSFMLRLKNNIIKTFNI